MKTLEIIPINQWWLKHLLYSFRYEHSYVLLNVNIHVYIAKLIHRNRIPTFEFVVCVHNNRFIQRVCARFALHEITFLHTIYYGHLQRIYLWWLVSVKKRAIGYSKICNTHRSAYDINYNVCSYFFFYSSTVQNKHVVFLVGFIIC